MAGSRTTSSSALSPRIQTQRPSSRSASGLSGFSATATAPRIDGPRRVSMGRSMSWAFVVSASVRPAMRRSSSAATDEVSRDTAATNTRFVRPS
jgi:hypothetical protein